MTGQPNTTQPTPASAGAAREGPRLHMSRRVWEGMIDELAARGQGERESGAFLLARVDDPHTVVEVAYYDDLDEACLTGGISFARAGYRRLWQICAESGLRVCADVHTHPGSGVRQSHTDATNPMIGQAGHVAVIVPRLAHRARTSRAQHHLTTCGVHVYAGNHAWNSTTGAANVDIIVLHGRLASLRHQVGRVVESVRARVADGARAVPRRRDGGAA